MPVLTTKTPPATQTQTNPTMIDSLLHPKQPPKPDWELEVVKLQKTQAQAKAKSDCDSQGGTLNGLDCVLPPPPPAVYVPVAYPVSANQAKANIYAAESGNNPARWNTSGCLGLGQACPASKLLAVCPNQADYACQDAWFTNYMLQSYGSWENAWAFWQRTDCRPYCGHWW